MARPRPRLCYCFFIRTDEIIVEDLGRNDEVLDGVRLSLWAYGEEPLVMKTQYQAVLDIKNPSV